MAVGCRLPAPSPTAVTALGLGQLSLGLLHLPRKIKFGAKLKTSHELSDLTDNLTLPLLLINRAIQLGFKLAQTLQSEAP